MSDPELDPYRPPEAPVGSSSDVRDPAGPEGGNPWVTIWKHPRGTIRRIVDTDPAQGVVALGAVAGFGSALAVFRLLHLGDRMTLAALIGLAALFGPIAGIVRLHAVGFAFWLVGLLFGGRGRPAEVRAAVAWGMVPDAAGVGLLGLMVVGAGQDFFRSVDPERLAERLGPIGGVLAIGQVVLGVWTLVVTLHCLAEVHRFSIWLALATALLVLFAVMFAVVAVLAVLVASGKLPVIAA